MFSSKNNLPSFLYTPNNQSSDHRPIKTKIIKKEEEIIKNEEIIKEEIKKEEIKDDKIKENKNSDELLNSVKNLNDKLDNIVSNEYKKKFDELQEFMIQKFIDVNEILKCISQNKNEINQKINENTKNEIVDIIKNDQTQFTKKKYKRREYYPIDNKMIEEIKKEFPKFEEKHISKIYSDGNEYYIDLLGYKKKLDKKTYLKVINM